MVGSSSVGGGSSEVAQVRKTLTCEETARPHQIDFPTGLRYSLAGS